ncbi:MAG: 2-oxo acid dehydrogenase subunit E2 [Planctomycetaceae bacterium]|nr:2-oxo acid dehydrogenase subunit E2 [Planctomycetaceae bacterium]
MRLTVIGPAMIPAPVHSRPVDQRQIPFLNLCYDYTAGNTTDTTMVWGSQVDMTLLREFLAEINATSRVIISPLSILARAVTLALKKHDVANSRLIGSQTYRFREQNILLPVQTPHGTALTLLRRVDDTGYEGIAEQVRNDALRAQDPTSDLNRGARFNRMLPTFLRRPSVRLFLWIANHFKLPILPINQHMVGAPVMINYFGFPCAAPLVSYKPSRFASRALLINVTLGPAHPQPFVVDNAVQIRSVAGLFVRADHRTMDARQLSDFVATIVEILSNPQEHDLAAERNEATVANAVL